MNETKKKYKAKIKSRKVDFYLCNEEIYLLSKSINFNKFVKEKLEELKEELKEERNNIV